MVEDLIKAINHFITVFSFRRMRKLKKKSYRSGTYKYQLNTFFFSFFIYTTKKKMIKDGMNHIIRVFSERRKRKL